MRPPVMRTLLLVGLVACASTDRTEDVHPSVPTPFAPVVIAPAPAPVVAKPVVPPSCIDDGKPFDQAMLRERVVTLASKELDGRVPGTDGDRATRKLIVDPALVGRYKEFAPRMDEARVNLKRVFDAGVKLVTGSDAGNPLIFHGPTVQEEVELWVAAGIPADKALVAATRTSAELLGQANRIGTIEKGKDANLLLVDGDPLKDVKSLSRISMVMLKGERVNRTALLKEDDN